MMRLWIVGRPNDPLEFSNDALAITIINSPTRIYKVEHRYGTFYPWRDITSEYSKQINATFEYWARKKKEESMKIKSVPKYSPGEVIDLSYKNGGLPNRIIITCAFWRCGDTQWVYKVFMESTGDYSVLDETFITTRITKHRASVYNDVKIQKRISDGWRFCGNFEEEVAIANGKLIAENERVANVRLWPALDPQSKYIKGWKGVWIKWSSIISNDGTFNDGGSSDTNTDIIDIK